LVLIKEVTNVFSKIKQCQTSSILGSVESKVHIFLLEEWITWNKSNVEIFEI
jgi:hypothetical protein